MQAKKQAAATGQAQQVVSVDKNGNTTTTTVQPPAAGTDDAGGHDDVTPGPGAPRFGACGGWWAHYTDAPAPDCSCAGWRSDYSSCGCECSCGNRVWRFGSISTSA